MTNDLPLWIKETLLKLNLVEDMNQKDGFSRLGYTLEEKMAHNQFQKIAEDLGLETHQDTAGNQWAIWKVNNHAGTIAVGSHLDTVYNGGGYDGVAGIVTALAAIKILKEKNFQPEKNIAIIVFACEESARFGVSTIGSKAICGLLDCNQMANIQDRHGITLEEAVNQIGLNWQNIEQSKISLHQIDQFIELHIEQGTQLEQSNTEIGIVQGIAQPTRLLITCTGMTNHTGTTPMDDRQDSLVPIALLISHIESLAQQLNEKQGTPIMATASTIKSNPNAMNMIPDETTIGVDIRSTCAKLKSEMVEALASFMEEIETERRVSFSIQTLADDNPIQLNKEIQTVLTNLCDELGFSSTILDSGAGHDVMNMALNWPSGLIFIPCREGISHHPSEYASIHHLKIGARLIASFLANTTKQTNGSDSNELKIGGI